MIINGVYGYNPQRDDFFGLTSEAKRRGITVTPDKNIIVRRFACEKGLHRIERIPTHYKTFREALRSFSHTLDSIQANLKRLVQQDKRMSVLHTWLGKKEDLSRPKQAEALASVWDFLAELYGVRSQNLVEAKELLEGEEMPTANLEQLLEERNWNAARALLVIIRSKIQAERERNLKQIYPTGEKEQLLGKMWEHDLAIAKILRQRALNFGRMFDKSRILQDVKSVLYESPYMIAWFTDNPFYFDLQHAKAKFQRMQRVVNQTKQVGDEAAGLLAGALAILRQHEEWLSREDSHEESGEKANVVVFKEAVR